MRVGLMSMSNLVGGVSGEWLLGEERLSDVCLESKVQTLLVGLKETLLLVVERKEPIDSSSSTAIKLEALHPKESLS